MAKKKAPAAPPAHRVLILVLLFYVAALVTMVALDRYVFVIKSLTVPLLLLAALASRRLTRFINDWAVFLAAVVCFDFGRGLAFALTTHFELPMYLDYVLTWERWLCGGAIAPLSLQHLRAALSDPVWLDRFFVLIYSSHYVFFFGVGFVIWYTRRAAFRTYALAITAVLYGGLVVYLLMPTIPPWIAANELLVLPPIVQLVRSFYNVHVPELLSAFDVNPIAAMPSLHTALPAICVLLTFRYFGRWGIPVALYALAVCVAVIYVGEHFLVDVVAGWILALVVYAGVHRWAPRWEAAALQPARVPADRWEVRPIAIALGLTTAAVGLGQLTVQWIGPLPITRAFIERELMGRSIVAHYYLGRVAFAHGDFAEAAVELRRSLADLSHPAQQKVIRTFLGISAFRIRDYPAAIGALEPLRADADDVSALVFLGNAYMETDQGQKGLAVLREARDRFPGEPEPLYWLTRYQYRSGEVDGRYVAQVIESLGHFPREKADGFRRSLSEVLQDSRAAAVHMDGAAGAEERAPATN